MKHLRLLLLCIPFYSFGQQKLSSGIQLGTLASLYSNQQGAFGLDFSANTGIARNFSIGIGGQAVKFQNVTSFYKPVFASFKYYIPSRNFRFFLHAEPGYAFYNASEEDSDRQSPINYRITSSKGSLYFSTGLGVTTNSSHTGPYLNFQYSLYQIRQSIAENNIITASNNINQNAFTMTVGVWLR